MANGICGMNFGLRKVFLASLLSVTACAVSSCEDASAPDGTNGDCGPEAVVCGQSCCSQTCCDGVCVDTDSDANHCGSCGHACEANEICTTGACAKAEITCDEDERLCDGVCINVQSDVKHCGDCSTVCADYEVCRKGVCGMDCGQKTSCDGICVDIQTDGLNCGACGNACMGNMYCSDSQCTCPEAHFDCDGDTSNGCESTVPCSHEEGPKTCEDIGLSTCGDLCVDIHKNPQHCGGCHKACIEGEICHQDECISSTDSRFCEVQGLGTCDGLCYDLNTDAQNCGSCGKVCEEHESCYKGNCMNSEEVPGTGANEGCFGSQVKCYGTCMDLRTDNDNCGSCLHKCAENEKCLAGVCELQCADSEMLCDGTCIDVQTDSAHCGSCDTSCLSGESCVEGACQCAEGRFDCDGDASNGCESTAECGCRPGERRPCWRGEPENRNKGICQDGEQVCDASGRFWGACTGGVYPSPLSCDILGTLNGLDNDCDGEVDTVCRSECDLKINEMSYIGCEYWSVYLYNLINGNHTLVFSNPSTEDTATVYIFNKSGFEAVPKKPVQTLNIAPKEVKHITLNTSWTNMCRSNGNANVGTSLLSNAYYIRSSHPVTAYQFNPFGYANANSNDASLLLPANVLGKKYLGMTWESESGTDHTSYITVMATEPGTTKVSIKTTAPIVAGDAIKAMNAGDTREFEMQRFDVLTLGAPAKTVDQTGTIIEGDKNIVVFGGSRATYVPAGAGCCRDHLEEQLFPLQSWGKSYFAVMAYSEDTAANKYKKGVAGNFYIIQAQLDNTTVTLPESLGGVKVLDAGKFMRFETRESFKVTADKPISVGQFLPSMNHNKLSIGDPSFLLVVPYEQYRSDYAFMVPDSYDNNFITIIAPKDAVVKLDNKTIDISTFSPIADSDFVYGYSPISVGVHRMEADKPFGLYSYGYHNMSSYGYPIGLDLKVINTN